MTQEAPELLSGAAEDLAAELLARLPAYVAGWQPAPGGAGWAVTQIYARYLQALNERVNRAPEKNKLAFLDQLGISLLSAQAARAPMAFKPISKVGDSRVPARTQVAAKIAGQSDPLVFETEQDIALTSANIAEVWTVWPGKDKAADHSQPALGAAPFTLFDGLVAIPHEIYLAHDTHLALAGQATVQLQFDLSRPGSSELQIDWSYWDGETWRGFKEFVDAATAGDDDSLDGTEGLTRSGVVRLVADCAATEKTTINGREAYWLRGAVKTALPPGAGRELPQVDRIRINTVVSRDGCTWTEAKKEVGNIVGIPKVFGSVLDDRGNKVSFAKVRFNFDELKIAGDGTFTGSANKNQTYSLKLEVFDPAQNKYVDEFDGSLNVGERSVQVDYLLRHGLELDMAFADGIELDLSKSVNPFGQQPLPGTSFYFSSAEVFSKPGATVTLCCISADTPATDSATNDSSTTTLTPALVLEYWNGKRWSKIDIASTTLEKAFKNGGPITFTLPTDLQSFTINDNEALWLRIRISAGTFGRRRTITWKDGAGKDNTLYVTEAQPPALAAISAGYVYESPQSEPELCLTYNDFQWLDESAPARYRGTTFAPFTATTDRTPTLYIGFDRPLPADYISLYLDIAEEVGVDRGPQLQWEYHDGQSWRALTVVDETERLALPGMLGFLWPGVDAAPAGEVLSNTATSLTLANSRQAAQFRDGDLLEVGEGEESELVVAGANSGAVVNLRGPLVESYERAPVSVARLPRFGRPRTWIRARLKSDGDPQESVVNGLFANAVWAAQVQSFSNEVLGSITEQRDQSFFFRQTPVLPGEVVEVRELSGPRAAVEWPILQDELRAQGLADDALRLVKNPRSGAVDEAWVRWQPQPNLFFSGPDDRHYMLERSRGRLRFGDNVNGRTPPAGIDNLRASAYRAGGGRQGNVARGAISQILSGVLAESVSNVRAAEGGADGETLPAASRRGPEVTRHRYQAISLADYEALAREASPAVAVARALPTTHSSGRPAPGWVRLIVMPQSLEAQPQPSFGLRRQIQAYVAARVPAAIADQVSVTGPTYLPIGVSAVIAPVDITAGATVLAAVEKALADFLHPLYGGPDSNGWPFGRDVYLSDVAAVVEAIAGVDYASTLTLLLDDTPQGEVVPVPPDRIVVAGDIEVTLTGA